MSEHAPVRPGSHTCTCGGWWNEHHVDDQPDRALAEATIRRCQAEGGNLADYLAEMIAGVRRDALTSAADEFVADCDTTCGHDCQEAAKWLRARAHEAGAVTG